MGEIADMMLEGILDCETGEYIGDQNNAIFCDEAPGFPVSYENDSGYNPHNYIKDINVQIPEPFYHCPVCNRRFKTNASYQQHYKAKHLKYKKV